MLSQSQNNIPFYQFTVFSLTVHNLNLLVETRGGFKTGPMEIFHIFSFNLDVGNSVFEFLPPPLPDPLQDNYYLSRFYYFSLSPLIDAPLVSATDLTFSSLLVFFVLVNFYFTEINLFDKYQTGKTFIR